LSGTGIPTGVQIPWIAVGVLGLITGSFLNAVIHRLPLGISLLNPSRSFCPRCGKTIPWYENLPVASWILLRGRCSGCALPIAIRYPLVELLTGGLYLLAWSRFGLPLAPVFWLFLSLLVAATFIDFDHLIIPDEITLGGTAAGILSATLFPRLMGASLWWQGLAWSLLGGALGYGLLWGVVELGKRAFGKRRLKTASGLMLEITGEAADPMLIVDGERVPLAELFYRESDLAEAACAWFEIDGDHLAAGTLHLDCTGISYGERSWSYPELTEVMPIRAGVTELILPREAMGFGDVKFLACIGAFLGWKGVFFSLFAGSIAGALFGIVMLAATKGRSGGRIPFGPYLALGALLWVLCGPELIDLYMGWITGGNTGAGFLLLLRRSPL
jgi:leader peptidase (prepilin peptidase)/N-methyltransferase